EFRRQIEYKARMKGIEVVFADLFFPSSKTCSNCGNIHKDLQLKDRIYVCPVCHHVIDRDLNASINLADCYIHQHNLVRG
ncbi:zinc ribbon domain-containing protein, partial [Dubosiella newyorkensis]